MITIGNQLDPDTKHTQMYNILIIPDELIHTLSWHEGVTNAWAGVDYNRQSVAKISDTTPPVQQLRK